MPPLRLSTGRSVTPLRRPGIAAVRDLRLEAAAVVAHPPQAELPLVPGDDGSRQEMSLPVPVILDYPIGTFLAPGISSLPTSLAVEGPLHDALEAFPETSLLSAPLPAPERIPATGPISLSASALGSDGNELELLRPLLELPLASEEKQHRESAGPPRAYQMAAVEKLLANRGFLLADDAGTGKTVSVCIALGMLFQKRQSRRALVVSPKPGRRNWADHLDRWSGGLVVRVVRGDRRARGALWKSDAHVLLTDYQTLAEDIARGALADEDLSFDALVMDNLQGVSRRSAQVADALARVRAERRWGLTGYLPQEAADWTSAFSLLLPGLSFSTGDPGPTAVRDRLLPLVLRRRKSDLVAQMPKFVRQEIWLDLEEGQATAYREALAEERYRLGKLGDSATHTHVGAAFQRLQQIGNFAPDSLDGPKVRALVDLVEEVTPAGGKVVVISQFGEQVLDRLRAVLEAYGVARMNAGDPPEAQVIAMDLFRGRPDRRILLAEFKAAGWGPLPAEASHVVHFDHDGNLAGRQVLEGTLFPNVGTRLPVNVYEFWMAETVEERLHVLLGERGMIAADATGKARPTEEDERLTVDDWLQGVLEVTQQRAARPTEPAGPVGTALLPGTSALRSQLAELSPERLMAGVEMLLRALGFGEARLEQPVSEAGGDILVERASAGGVERLLVRCLRSAKNVGVGEGRQLLKDIDARTDLIGAYLVVTSDCTEALRKFADASDGRLSLVSGSELYRHLQILGLL